jgi:hypothetical protein
MLLKLLTQYSAMKCSRITIAPGLRTFVKRLASCKKYAHCSNPTTDSHKPSHQALEHYENLAYIAYVKGFCDDELISITNDNSMFKQQARYLMKRRQLESWAQVLVPKNIHHRQLIDQVSLLPITHSFS